MAPSSPATDLWTGRLVGGRWRIRSLLDDSGGMASVYLADDERLPRKAVVKIPKAAQFNAEFAERFAREAFWHAKVENLHVVHILDRGEEAGTPFLVLQYLPGGNLKVWCERSPSILSDPRLHYEAWLLPIAQALDAVAAQGIVHRDVKPSNILFDSAGQAYLSDFGIVKAGGDATMTGKGMFIGTLHFMSPEQFKDDGGELDGRSDQYGLAMTVYQVITGWKYPVDDTTIAQIVSAKLGLTPMKPPRSHDQRIPTAVSDVVMRGLSADREKRFSSNVAFAEALMAAFEAGDVPAPPPPPPPPPRRGMPLAASATVVGAMVVGGLIAMRTVSMPMRNEPGEIMPAVPDPPVREPVVPKPVVPPPLPPHALSPGETLENSIGMEFVVIPAGTFTMGSDETKAGLAAAGIDADGFDGASEGPVHEVRITRPFLMGVHEVTVGQFLRFYEDAYVGKLDCERGDEGGWGYDQANAREPFGRNRRHTPFAWGHPGMRTDTDAARAGALRHPVVNVSWYDCVAFCDWLSRKEGRRYRLPTEAEWEYACRAGTTTRFWLGDEPDSLAGSDNVADATAREMFSQWSTILGRDGHVFPSPVGSFAARNAFGLADVHGNVAEWVLDRYDASGYGSHRAAGATDPLVPRDPAAPDAAQVIRGGSWDRGPVHCRGASRTGGQPTQFDYSVGFRVVREME